MAHIGIGGGTCNQPMASCPPSLFIDPLTPVQFAGYNWLAATQANPAEIGAKRRAKRRSSSWWSMVQEELATLYGKQEERIDRVRLEGEERVEQVQTDIAAVNLADSKAQAGFTTLSCLQ